MHIRKATIEDIKSIHSMLHRHSHEGDLIPRPLSKLYDHVRDFTVAVDEAGGRVIGCCALQFCWEDLGEIRSLVVEPPYRNQGVATALVESCVGEARSFGMTQLFSLTFKADFFGKFGFVEIERSELPLKIWADCMLCVKFPDCEGIAMMKAIG